MKLEKAIDCNYSVKKVFLKIHWRLIFGNVMRCSRLRLWVDYFIYFKLIPVFFYWIFLIDILWIEERNSLISIMLNIYLKISIEKNWLSQNFDFLSLQVSLWEFYLTQVSLNFKTSCCNLKIRGLKTKLCVASHYFNVERNYNVLKSENVYFF